MKRAHGEFKKKLADVKNTMGKEITPSTLKEMTDHVRDPEYILGKKLDLFEE